MEEKVGIEGFISENRPITRGILKHLCSDFVVEEVGLDRKLASRNGPTFEDCVLEQQMISLQRESELRQLKRGEERAKKRAMSEEERSAAAFSKLKDDLENFSKLQKELEFISFKEDEFTSFLSGQTNSYWTDAVSEKSNRTLVHQKVREIFAGLLLTECPGDNKIKITKRSGNGVAVKQGFRDVEKPADQYPFLQFCLTKIGMDTGEAMHQLERKVKMKNCFSVAGNKDRRAITCQFVHARNMTPRRILGLVNKGTTSERDHRIISVTGIRVVDDALKMGDLRGNRFRLIIRDISSEDGQELKERIDKFTKFINYFGLQRFGNRLEVPSYRLGICLLKKEWISFVSLLLDPIEGEEDGLEGVRKWWRDCASSTDKTDAPFIPRRFVAEREVISMIKSNHPSTLDSSLANKAIRAIPRELRMMYAHSLQSFIWNKVATRRLERHGLQVVAGEDLVFNLDASSAVVVVVADQKSTPKDIVLPVPGYDSIYPKSSVEDYLQVSRELGIIAENGGIEDLSLFFKKAGDVCGHLSGAYRALFVEGEEMDLKGELVPYSSGDEEIEWDFGDAKSDTGKYLSLVLSFTLPSSSYATMFLREIFHSTTDPLQHKIKSQQHQTDRVQPNANK